MEREERGDWQHKWIGRLFIVKLIGYQQSRGWVWRVRCPCGHHRAIGQRYLIDLAKYTQCPKCHYKPEVTDGTNHT